MNNKIEPELPSIMPDIDQVEAFKQTQTPSNNKKTSFENSENVPSAPAQTSNVALWLGAISIIALAAGGFILHQQSAVMQTKLAASERRIAELENALSATGEELGQSAGAIQAKLSTLTERTDELWSQMDKLWASAWRRNQSEIKELQEQATKIASTQSQHTNSLSDMTSNLNNLSQNQSEMTLKLALFQEQLQTAETLKKQLTTMSADLDQLKSQSQNRDSKQIEIGSTLAQLEMTQTALAEQLQRLESKLASTTTPQQKLN
ncbi:hypothetical protein ACSLBF_13110 [Pseudoalteromonas sp. T1lg65]|uniref:hypothetical protein n=1 Tax=Pseudoalteromonas sp. T1lg65 TaxID=2077101 RepID=UPI003F78B426